MMHNAKKRLSVVWIMVAVCLSIPAMASAANGIIQKAERKYTVDYSIPVIYSPEIDIDGKGGCSADINDDLGLGFAGAYNFNNHFQLGGFLNWSSRSYDATVVMDDDSTFRYNSRLDTSTIAVNGTYFILDTNLTPFVTANLGYTFVDTNIQDGPPQGFCWWDPWWGYVCSSYVPTKTESDFSYGLGLGVRFDFNLNFSMQASYNMSWVDLDSSGSTDFDNWQLGFIFHPF